MNEKKGKGCLLTIFLGFYFEKTYKISVNAYSIPTIVGRWMNQHISEKAKRAVG